MLPINKNIFTIWSILIYCHYTLNIFFYHISYHLAYKIVELDNTQKEEKKKWSALMQLKQLLFTELKGKQISYKNKRAIEHLSMRAWLWRQMITLLFSKLTDA